MTLNFPSNPSDQEEYSGYIYDATKGVWNKQPTSSDLIPEGTGNLYFTNQRAIDATSDAISSAISSSNSYTDGQISSIDTSLRSYTDTAISSLIDSAPSTLDTLNELAAALNDDSNFATSIINTINSLEVNSLADVTIATPADGEVLTYNQGSWENQAVVIPESRPHPFTMIG